MRIALTIAGSDSGGGAGIQADLKTFHQFGVFGTSVICAVTAQNTRGVLAWEAVSPALVARQLDAVAEDLPPTAVKSGMLGTADVAETVAAGIARHRLPNYVLDPVMVATSGDRLLDRAAERLVAERLVPLAPLLPPNRQEAPRRRDLRRRACSLYHAARGQDPPPPRDSPRRVRRNAHLTGSSSRSPSP